jgi:hypothetical protein
MSKGSWNAQRGCFENAVYKGDESSPSAGLQGQLTHAGTHNSISNNWVENTPQPSPVDSQTIYSNSLVFYRSIDDLRSLMNMMSEQLDVLSTFVPEQEPVCLEMVTEMKRDMALMCLNLASSIYSASLNKVARTGSPNPPSPSASPTGSPHED